MNVLLIGARSGHGSIQFTSPSCTFMNGEYTSPQFELKQGTVQTSYEKAPKLDIPLPVLHYCEKHGTLYSSALLLLL